MPEKVAVKTIAKSESLLKCRFGARISPMYFLVTKVALVNRKTVSDFL